VNLLFHHHQIQVGLSGCISPLELPVEILVGADEQQESSRGVVLVSQQEEGLDAAKL
jgi:hypothetical protein